MKLLGSRQLGVGLVALAVASVGLLPESAEADKAMFRVEQRFHGSTGLTVQPLIPPIGSPACGQGGPGTMTPDDCGGAEVGSTTPAAKFTLPKSWQKTYFTTTLTSYTGYYSRSTISSYNGVGKFGPSAPYGATTTTKVLFPTTMGNTKVPNKGSGAPATPTTTFGGDFDFSRGGSINITPGPNQFGGTMRFLYGPNAAFYQFISYNSPFLSKAYGSFVCKHKGGATCSTQQPSTPGQITSSGMVSRFRLTSAGGAKATDGMGGYIVSKAYYLQLIAPWTTAKVNIVNPLNLKTKGHTDTGYDATFSGGTTKVFTRTYTTTTTMGMTGMTTQMETLTGITRITSLVRPRLRHTYLRPNDPMIPVSTQFQAARLWGLRIFFLPEPGSMLMIGSGIAVLAGLAWLRRS